MFTAVGRMRWIRNDLGLEHMESLGRAVVCDDRNENTLSGFKVAGGKGVGRTNPRNAQRSYTIERERAAVGRRGVVNSAFRF